MKTLLLLTLALLSFSTTTLAITPRAKKMKAFRSERELERYFHKIAERQKPATKLKVAEAAGAMTETVTVTSSPQREESITNTQHLGVDEGGIVEVRLSSEHPVELLLHPPQVGNVAGGDRHGQRATRPDDGEDVEVAHDDHLGER